MTADRILIRSETRTVEYVRFKDEKSLEVVFTDGGVMHVISQTPISCLQGGGPGDTFEGDWLFGKGDTIS